MIPLRQTKTTSDNHPLTRELLLQIYDRLFAAYGPQRWWPAEEPFEVMVGAILTQSTAWRNVEKAITNLKKAGALSPAALRQLSLPEIATLIRPSGYYNAKSRKLKALARWLGESCSDELDRLSARSSADLRDELLAIHGVGPETADSILLYAIGQPVFVIDAYTRRIIGRIGLAPQSNTYASYQTLFMDNLPFDSVPSAPLLRLRSGQVRTGQGKPSRVGLFNEYHALLVQLGKDTCRKQPRCAGCCLAEICQFEAEIQVRRE